ncbi:MAG: hypothetical protein ACFHVJ_06960 [Aestuariibacter sp.]
MKIIIKASNLELDKEERQSITQRVNFVFARVKQHVDKVIVSLCDSNGPKGGEDLQCRIKINAAGIPTIVVRMQSTTLLHAINVALQRSSTNLIKKLKRKQQFRQHPIHLGTLVTADPTA